MESRYVSVDCLYRIYAKSCLMVNWNRTKEILKQREGLKIIREYSGPVCDFIELETRGKHIRLTHIKPPGGSHIPASLGDSLYHVAIRK